MPRFLKFFLLFAFAALSAPLSAQNTDIKGTWTAELRNARVFLQVRTRLARDWNGDRWNGDWNMGQTFPIDELAGLPANDDQFTVGSIKFDLRREAGTLAMEGAFRDGRGAGLFTFTPRAEYTAEMKSLGFPDDLPLWRRFQLALHDVGPKYIRALKAEGYDKLPLDQIQRAKTHGVTIDYIRDLKAQGFRSVTLENLVRTRDHGVTGDYIKALKAEGYTGATLEDFVRTRDHGVTQAYIQGMKKAGFGSATVDDLVRAKDHGVSPEFIQEIRGLGLSATTLEEFVRLRDHGVRAAFVQEMKAAGYDKVRGRGAGAAARSRRHRRLRPRSCRAGLQERPARGRRPDEGPWRLGRLRRRHEGAGVQGPHAAADRAAARPRDHARLREPRQGPRPQAGERGRSGAL